MTDRLIEWFNLALRESMEFYVWDLADYDTERLHEEIEENGCVSEEDYIEFLINEWDDPIEWYVSNFGELEFGEACLVALGYKNY